jgi:hypothetical protein
MAKRDPHPGDLTYYYEAYFRAVTTNVAGLLFVLVLAVFLARLRGARNVYRPSEWTGAGGASSSSLFFVASFVPSTIVSRFV